MSSCLATRVLWTQLILLNIYQMSTLVEELIMKGMKVKVTQSCLTLCDPVDYTVHEILQAKILEWVAFPFSRGSPQPRDWTQVSYRTGKFFTSWATKEAPKYWSGWKGIFLTQETTGVSCIADRFFTNWAIREASSLLSKPTNRHIDVAKPVI